MLCPELFIYVSGLRKNIFAGAFSGMRTGEPSFDAMTPLLQSVSASD